MEEEPQRISIVIVSWNGRDDLIRCLSSVSNLRYEALDVSVVDNASDDGTQQAISGKFPWVTVIQNSRNMGYAVANNQVMSQKLKSIEPPAYIWLLNQDVIVFPSSLDRLVNVAEKHPEYGILGSKTVRYYTPNVADIGEKLNRITGRSKRLTVVPEGSRDYIEVDIVWGCAMLLRTKMLETIGLFREDFFMYGEDADLCLRAARHGWKSVTVLDSIVYHKLSESANSQYVQQSILRIRNNFLVLWSHFDGIARVRVVMIFMFWHLPRSIVKLWKMYWCLRKNNRSVSL